MANCSREGCRSFGQFRPLLEMRSKKNGPITHLRFIQIVMCENHQQSSVLEHFLSPEGFDRITKQLKEAGKTPPSKKYIRLVWENVEPEELDSMSPLILETPTVECENLAF